jgi:hypothetical protein
MRDVSNSQIAGPSRRGEIDRPAVGEAASRLWPIAAGAAQTNSKQQVVDWQFTIDGSERPELPRDLQRERTGFPASRQNRESATRSCASAP